MSLNAIMLGAGPIAAIVGVAYWFAGAEQKVSKPALEMDEETRQKLRESAASITNLPMP